jgi:hypothetical protein
MTPDSNSHFPTPPQALSTIPAASWVRDALSENALSSSEKTLSPPPGVEARVKRRGRWVLAGSVAAALAALALVVTLMNQARSPQVRAEAQLVDSGPAGKVDLVCLAEQDLNLARRLEEIPLLAIGWRQREFDWQGVLVAYREAFAGYGIDLDVLAPAEAAERIRASAIREPLVVALDLWATLLIEDKDQATRERLLKVAGLADRNGGARTCGAPWPGEAGRCWRNWPGGRGPASWRPLSPQSE